MREVLVERKTNETNISLSINLDGKGISDIDTGCGFLNHMLTLFAKHGRFDLKVKCVGDTDVDYHHTVEDIGIVLGTALKKALGDKKGIVRYGDKAIVMDESLIQTAIDLSGRATLVYKMPIPAQKVLDFDVELIEEFFLAFVRTAECSLHIIELNGKNSHHIIEGAFKSFARTLKEAVSIDQDFIDEIPSTKGTL
jgi:imidazoleglycerol-phosphate dehydratase